MFGFGKKEVKNEEIKAFNSAMKAVDIFMTLSEWDKAKKALKEIEYKEKQSLNEILEKLDNMDDSEGINDSEKRKLNIEFKKKQKIIEKKELELEKREKNYLENIEKERFKIRFEKIREEVKVLTGHKKNDQAIALLQKFLDENSSNTLVVSFYNKEKKILLKNKERERIKNEKIAKENAKLEAMALIGETVNIEKKSEKSEKKLGFFAKLKLKLNFYKSIKERIKRKRLLDEISILIEEDSKIKTDLAKRKLANIHKGLVKELKSNNVNGYQIYGKILGADKISGDTFGINESIKKYNIFLGDATGHGIRAGFIITLLSRIFNKHVASSNLQKLTFEINNGLKQDLKSRNFITAVFFEILKENVSKINFVGMGHEPIFIFRKKEEIVEKFIPGGLAAGIRLIKNPEDIKEKTIKLEDGDILITYSDGIIENKNSEGDFYGLERLQKSISTIAKSTGDINKIYEYIINDVKLFRGGAQFDDDATVLILKRDIKKDIIDEESEYLEKLQVKEGLKASEVRKLKGKSIEDIEKELVVLKKEKETNRIVKILENLYYTGEVLKLKQEAIRFIKEGFIDKRINDYLKKAIANEKTYKIEQKNQRIHNKYTILEELMKKGDFDTIIKEAEEIIGKDGNI